MQGIDAAAVVAEYGAYYVDRGQGPKDIYELATRGFTSKEVFTPVMTDDTIWQATTAEAEVVIQPFQVAFTPLGGVKFDPTKITMYRQKVDMKFSPDALWGTYLGFLTSNKLRRDEWPFIRWYLDKKHYKGLEQQQELSEFANGVYLAPTANVASPAGKSMNGYRKVIADWITVGRITPITMGAVPTNPSLFVDYVHDFTKQINKLYWQENMTLNVSETMARRYQEGVLDKYGKNTVMNDQDLKVRFTNITMKPLPAQFSSNRMWCSPVSNCIRLEKATMNQKLIDLQVVDREVKLLSDWAMGVGFVIPEIVFCSDQV
jgi:hypothetical protein